MICTQTEHVVDGEKQSNIDPIIVVGNGPVGVKASQLILSLSDNYQVNVFGDETHAPYNRVQLSLFLAGNVSENELKNPISRTTNRRLNEKVGFQITQINRKNKFIIDQYGIKHYYHKLILATGSRPNIPELPGIDKEGVFTFRSIEDAKNLIRCRTESKRILIIGSGALGLETANAMKTQSNHVYVSVRDQLLSYAFDQVANKTLKDRLNSTGIKFIYDDPLVEILGKKRVKSVKFRSGIEQKFDTIVFCTGIKPNTDLAVNAQLDTKNGIVVNDYMQTSDPNIYAIGECAEYKGATYGIVAPGYEQAEIGVNHILGRQLHYKGSTQNLLLKIGHHSSGIYGSIDDKSNTVYVYNNRLKGVYRKVLVRNNTLVGMIFVGQWSEENALKDAINKREQINNKKLDGFCKTGFVWEKEKPLSVNDQPSDYIVCLCENVTRGCITDSMKQGNRTIESLGESTRAGVTCGSCKPIIAEMLDVPLPNVVMRHHNKILWYSVLSILMIIATIVFEPIKTSSTVQLSWKLEMLWFDNFWKQISGYSLLTLCILGGLLSARKRMKKVNFGNLDNWRLYHSVLGVVALVVLMIHTGFRLGSNLNFVLMMVFLSATTTGSLVGVFMSKNRHWSDRKLQEHRKWWSRIHYSLLWLLPALLSYHIFAVYYF